MATDGTTTLEIGPLAAAPGTLVTGWLPVGEDWRRRADAVPVALLHGAAAGPVLYIQALSDGDELNGLAVLRRLLAALDPGAMRGAIVAVLVANPGAFAAGQACDPRDGRKLNRCFPGQPHGTVTERLAFRLFHDLVLRCNLVIDLHQNGNVPMVCETRVRTGPHGARHADSLELAFAFGLPFLLDQQGPSGQLARVAPGRGIPAIDPELGGNHGIDSQAVDRGVQGVLNVLVHYGLLAGHLVPPAGVFVARRLVPLVAAASGLLEHQVELGRRVVEGQTIATITDIFGARPSPVLAPQNGVLWIRRDQPLVASGDSVGALGVESEA